MLNAKRLRKQSRVERLESQLALMTHIASEYEKVLVQIAQYTDKFAHTVNPARKVLQKINSQLTGRSYEKH